MEKDTSVFGTKLLVTIKKNIWLKFYRYKTDKEIIIKITETQLLTPILVYVCIYENFHRQNNQEHIIAKITN